MKIASMKNEKPSIANPSPNTPPNVAVKFGHSSPISKLRIVPVITPDGEQRHHHPAPAPGQRPVQRVAGAQVQPLDEQHHRRERDPERHQRDVHRERQRLHLPRLEQVLLVNRSEGRGEQMPCLGSGRYRRVRASP